MWVLTSHSQGRVCVCVCVCICHFFHQGAIFSHALALPLTSCVSLDMSLNLSEPQFPPPKSEDDSTLSCICCEGHNPMLLSSGRTFLAAERCTKWDVMGCIKRQGGILGGQDRHWVSMAFGYRGPLTVPQIPTVPQSCLYTLTRVIFYNKK